MAQWALLESGFVASDDQQVGILTLEEFVEYANRLEMHVCEKELLEWPCQNLMGGTGEAIYSSVDGMCTHKECHPKNKQEEEWKKR